MSNPFRRKYTANHQHKKLKIRSRAILWKNGVTILQTSHPTDVWHKNIKNAESAHQPQNTCTNLKAAKSNGTLLLVVFKGAGDTADIVQLLEAGGNYFWLMQRINNATLCSSANYTKCTFGLLRNWDTWPDADHGRNARMFVYLGAGCRRRRKWCRADSPHRWDWSLPCSPSCFQKPLKIPSMCNTHTHTQRTQHIESGGDESTWCTFL